MIPISINLTLAFFNISTVDSDFDAPVIQRSFNPEDQPRNMPADFKVQMDTMIPLMGGHAWDQNKNPPNNLEWVDPIWIMGPYDGGLIAYEPMIPMAFFSGPDREFSEAFSYEGKTIDTLPSSYTVNYDSSTKKISLTFIGISAAGTCDMKVHESGMDEDSMTLEEEDNMIMEDSGAAAATFFRSFVVVMSSFLLF